MSFIDNLNNINCTADLFRYIGELETKLEEVEKQRDLLLIQMDLKEQRIKELEHKLFETEHTLEFYESKITPKKECNND